MFTGSLAKPSSAFSTCFSSYALVRDFSGILFVAIVVKLLILVLMHTHIFWLVRFDIAYKADLSLY